jgi:hypothetical protein
MTAVDTTLSVAFPVVAALLKVMVFGAAKFDEAGVPKLQVGKSTAPDGGVTAQMRVAVPVNPLTAFKVMGSAPD